VPSAVFSEFAAASLTRWRALAGCAVSPRDSRWGAGRVRDIRWEGRSDRPDDRGSIYVRVEYAGGLRVRVHARSFGRIHGDVVVDAPLADFVLRWYAGGDPPGDESERTFALAAFDRVLQDRQDEERGRCVEALRQRSSARGAPGSSL